LIQLGIPAERLITRGVGANVPDDCREDEFKTEVFDDAAAQKNRKATVYSADKRRIPEDFCFQYGSDISSLRQSEFSHPRSKIVI
jgi:hypothetical protein